jgi:hypothetical protein
VPTATNTPIACTDSGYLSPSSNGADTGGDGNGFETNPTGAYATGGTFATNNNGGGGDSHRYYTYGISLPSGCTTVAGIVARLDYWVFNNSATTVMVELSWDGGTTWTAGKSDTSKPQSQTTVLFGSSVDAWGHTWTSGNLSNANFRVRVTMTGNASQDFFLDWLPVRVYFAP